MIDTVALLHIRDRKVLVARSRGVDRWYLPGGKREPGETDEDTLRREIREELSVEIRSDTLDHVGTYEGVAHGQRPGTLVRMACYAARWTGELAPGSEIEQLEFLGFDDLGEAAPLVQHIFHDLRAKQLI
ncbi:MAG TPA: NUDIX domain-containing protein [Kofleriaceae bacterium]|nr:NUDIX domain-containing protein [Kofleriaceae bacterium]